MEDYSRLAERFFSAVNDEKDADFIIFPYSIDTLYHHLGYEEFSRFLRQLPLFSEYERKFVFFLLDDISPGFDVASVIYRVNHDNRKKDKNSITLPYFVDDIFQPLLSDTLLYHVNFVGTIVTHVLRAYMLLPLLSKEELSLYHALLGKLDHVLANRKNHETCTTVMADAMSFVKLLFPHTPSLKGINYFIDVSVEQFPRLPRPIQDIKKSELVDIMSQSLATLCPRGFGVQSIRFFETLSAGRIPILISDHYVLPLESHIDYSDFVWRVNESQIMDLANVIAGQFGSNSENEIMQCCALARVAWEKYFAPSKRDYFVYLTLSEVLRKQYQLNNYC